MKLITFHAEAEAEVTEGAQYYEARSLSLGAELLREVEQALVHISTNPEACQRVGKRLRRKALWRFPYNLIYAVYPDQIRIVRLLIRSGVHSTGESG